MEEESQSPPSLPLAQRVVVIVWDGMRPDLVGDDLTPRLAAFMRDGATYGQAVGVFPSVTRPTTSSVSTGSYPLAHGVLSNMFIGPPGDRAPLDTGDRDALQRLRAVNGGRVLPLETLAEAVTAAGKTFVCMGSGSTGQVTLLDPENAGTTIHTAFTHPAALMETVTARFGQPPIKAIPVQAANDWLTDILTGYVLPEMGADVVIAWYCEPDASQHATGLGSPETAAAIRGNDARFGRTLDAISASGVPTVVIVASDHGHSTVTGMVRRTNALVEGGFGEAIERGDILLGEQAITVEQGADDALRVSLGTWLAAQPWAAVRIAWPDAGAGDVPEGALAPTALYGDRPRPAFPHAPTWGFSYTWTDAPNAHGIPGTAFTEFYERLADFDRLQGHVVGLNRLTATHGTLSPRDQRTVLALGGAGIRGGAILVPAGVVDIAPTVLALLGLPPLPDADGRPLLEAFAGGPAPESVEIETETLATLPTGDLRRYRIGVTTYIETDATR